MTQSAEWYLAQAESRRAQLTELGRFRYGRLAAAAGVDPDKLTPNAQLVLVWLAGWDEDTVAGSVEILGTARSAAALAAMAEMARQAEQVVIAGQRSMDDELAELTGHPAAGDELAARRQANR